MKNKDRTNKRERPFIKGLSFAVRVFLFGFAFCFLFFNFTKIQVEAAPEETARLAARLAAAREEVARLAAQLAAAREEADRLAARLAAAREEADQLEARLAVARKEADQLEARLAAAREETQAQLTAVYCEANMTIPTRFFKGPGQYPPKDFRAYGILVFPQRATEATRKRHIMICNAYVAALPHVTELPNTPRSQQMVTVWPIEKDHIANVIDLCTERSDVCEKAVDHYGLVLARAAINDAAKPEGSSIFNFHKRGPFLFAWAPGSKKGARDALVLSLDLTRVNVPEQAEKIFERWIQDIQKDPNMWSDGWDILKIKLQIALWADDIGGRTIGSFIGD